jgi:hypothetical protein
MIVSYRDPNSATGYTAPAPVIWDRPAGFSRELANKLMVAGDLRNTLVLITRNGKAGDMQTTYSMDILPETHPIFKPEMIPNDFSAFNGFNIARHSYWEKTAEEIQVYLTTGQFPERTQNNNQVAVNNMTNTASAYGAQSTLTPTEAGVAPSTPAYQTPVQTAPVQTIPAYTAPEAVQYAAPVAPMAAPATVAPANTATTPVRNFTGFSF